MHQARHRRMGVFPARIAHFPGRGVGLLHPRHDLPADGAILVRRVNQIEEIRRDGQGQFVIGQEGAFVFLRRQRGQEAPQLFQRGDALFELPAPIVPIGFATSLQKPLPAEWNCFKEWNRAESGSSVSVCPSSMMLCIFRHYKIDRKCVKWRPRANGASQFGRRCAQRRFSAIQTRLARPRPGALAEVGGRKAEAKN